jgi:glycerophosphoryl diester phosphodiesterase
MGKLIFIAHRGAPVPARRENSIAALQRAVSSQRFAYVEIDIQRTRTDDDGLRVPILAHHSTIDALYDLQRIPKNQRTHQGVELSSLTYNMLKDASLEITTLSEAIEVLKGQHINLEIKDISALPQTLAIINEAINLDSVNWQLNHFVLSSFNWDILYKAKEMDSNINVALLYGVHNIPTISFKHIYKLEPRFIIIQKWIAPIISPWLALRGYKHRYVYTVNNKLEIYWLRLFGVNGFITDSVSLPEKF